MLLYFLKSRKDTKSKKPNVIKTAVSDSNKLRFIKKQEASGLLSSLGIKTSLTKTPLVGRLLI